ncbi:hypothetical protein ACLBX9_13150 [Methylobacterium sp. A49B]
MWAVIRSVRAFLRRPGLNEAQGVEARAVFDTPLAPMPEIQPSNAGNDDPLRTLHDAVERELRVANLIC